MSNGSKGLGRGLNALFNSPGQEGQPETPSPMTYVKVEDILPNPNQPRKAFTPESLQDLANSIRIQGVLQPILVQNANSDGKYVIIAGERRWRAAQMAGLAEIPVIIRTMANNEALIATMMENLHRDNLNPLEEAQGLANIMEMLSLTQTELANALGAQRGTITNILRVLRLSPQAKDDLVNNRITQGHARCLVTLPEQESEILRQRIIDLGMSVRATEMALSYWNQTKQFPWHKPGADKKFPEVDPNIKRLAKRLTHSLNCITKIKGTRDKGKINLSYDSSEQLAELLEKLGLTEEEIQKATQ